ncbi:beta-glucoside-specific PTS transporter subunit IIABC [Paenibacillus bovis]|uniref:PTS beta-glucoside transporter subunit EIIBCA n=1 Tax=Paenibacillus bovis TaxID=1616788 RepID=A0A172ZC87_9BACL|nr:beta-glucoside-specific PTS transporter subunit IIABC [Paenibacillus bovis]ANF94982.1 PTS beta-glucoside transporter subunit EIIBCA [Paenibacillus bovis]
MSGKVRDYPKLANDILKAVGGESNVTGATRCATRLRLVLKQSSPQAKEAVASMPGVITVVENAGQFQVVIGQHVGEVYDEFAKLVNLDTAEEQTEHKGTILNRIIATMSAVFAPFVYILAAAGIMQGLLIIANLLFAGFAETGTYQVISFISWAPFTFLPIFIAITAAKHFKTNTYIAVACCAALVSPSWAEMAAKIADGGSVNFLGIALTETTYTSSVLPPLFLVWILSYLERFLNKRMNEIIRPLFVPLLCMLIMVPLTIVLIGPITTLGANGIANGYNFLAENAPALAGAIIGGFWQVIVIFGVHWGVTPMVLANFEQYGRDSFQAYQTIAVVAQIGAVLGVILKARNQETRKIGISAGVTGLFGITEPAIYGVTLRFKKPMIFGCISGAVGAVVASFFNPYYFAYAGLPGPLTIVNSINADYPSSVWGILIGSAIAIVLPVILIQIFGYGVDEAKASGDSSLVEQQGQTGPAQQNDSDIPAGEENIASPLRGKIVPLTSVPDEAFSSGAMGSGIAIEPTDNKLYAPFDGTVATIAPTRHAIGLRSNTGVELFIHIGLDTVKLKGAPFTLKVQDGDTFRKGDLLLEFDKELIQREGIPTITPVLVTNAFDYKEIVVGTLENATTDADILTVVR